MAIKIDVKEYCTDCCDFEADVTKPEKTYYYDCSEQVCESTSDTIVRCRYSKRCEAIKRFLEKQKENKE